MYQFLETRVCIHMNHPRDFWYDIQFCMEHIQSQIPSEIEKKKFLKYMKTKRW